MENSNNNTIPLVVYQTWHTKLLPEKMRYTLNHNKVLNNEFQFEIYDENDCRNFIKTNFNDDVLECFDRLVPSAYKADLWRYCILYVNGGIYMDIKFKCVNNFKLINLIEKEQFVIDVLLDEYPNDKLKGVCNGFIVSFPNNKKLLQSIYKIVENVKNKFFGNSPLDPTGPVLLGQFFSNEEKKNFLLKRYIGNNGNGVSIGGTIILDEYPEYRLERSYNNKSDYIKLWEYRNIYG